MLYGLLPGSDLAFDAIILILYSGGFCAGARNSTLAGVSAQIVPTRTMSESYLLCTLAREEKIKYERPSEAILFFDNKIDITAAVDLGYGGDARKACAKLEKRMAKFKIHSYLSHQWNS